MSMGESRCGILSISTLDLGFNSLSSPDSALLHQFWKNEIMLEFLNGISYPLVLVNVDMSPKDHKHFPPKRDRVFANLVHMTSQQRSN